MCVANKYQGEAELKREGADTLTLRIGSRTLCQVEAALGKPLSSILDDLGSKGFRVTTLMTILRFAVVRKDLLSQEQACDLIDQFGYEAVQEAIQTALNGAMGVEVNPPPAPTADDKG